MATPVGRRDRMGVADWIVFASFASLSVWLAVALAWRARTSGLTWTGTDGPYLGDQMQYLGWVRDASDNLRIGNSWRLTASRELFVHPGLALSGFLHRLGLSPAVAYLAWKPVGVVFLFVAVRAYVVRLVSGTLLRTVALVLALIAVAPMSRAFFSLGIGPPENAFYFRAMALDMWPGLYLWGYPFTAIAVALLPTTLLLHERARRAGRVPAGAALCGFFCAWLQPWQGATLAIVLVATEVLCWRRERIRPGPRLVATLAATVVPLAYYAVLSRFDPTWYLAGQANRFDPWPWWTLPLFLLPIAVVVSLEYRRPAPTFQHVALRVWPVAAIGLFWFISYTPFGTFPLHSLQGLSIPVAVLSVRSIASLGSRPDGVVTTALLGPILVACVGYGLVHELQSGVDGVLESTTPYFLAEGEHRAVERLERDPRPGGVLARVYLGQTVPALTGRRTWVGIKSWTPDYEQRVAEAEKLFSGRMGPAAARSFVRRTGARFLLSDCRPSADLGPLLGPMVQETRRFDCATVYLLR